MGVVDRGEDITIIGGEMFKQVAAAAKLRKRDFKPPDRTPRADYYGRPSALFQVKRSHVRSFLVLV